MKDHSNGFWTNQRWRMKCNTFEIVMNLDWFERNIQRSLSLLFQPADTGDSSRWYNVFHHFSGFEKNDHLQFIISCIIRFAYGGFINGATPIAGWLFFRGFPHLWNPPYVYIVVILLSLIRGWDWCPFLEIGFTSPKKQPYLLWKLYLRPSWVMSYLLEIISPL